VVVDDDTVETHEHVWACVRERRAP
jgi:hypothetical protein